MLTHIRLDAKMEEEIQKVISSELFSSKSEFIRDAIRKSIESYKAKVAQELLDANFKSFDAKHMTKKDRQDAFNELVKLKKL